MAPLTVDPAALDGAGAATISAGQGLGPVISTLTSALSGCSGMAGDDPAGAAFGRSYDSSSSKLLEAMATTRNGLCRLGDGVRMSAHNYSVAEAMSNLSGHGEPLPVPPPTGPVSAGSAPSAVGDSTGAPAGWGWVAPFIGMIWPTGDSAKLRAAAAAWLSAGTNFEVTEIQGVAGPMGTIGAQQIPEIPAITTAFGDAVRSASGILQQCVSIATQLGAYATKIDTVHAAILDLLSRICDPTTGLKEVVEFLTDQDEDEIKKIANDIRTIVNNFTAEVKALCQEIATLVSEAETIITTMGRYAEKEWDQFLHHTAVGRALDQVGQFGKGVAEEAGGLIKDGWDYGAIRPFFDPKGSYDSWSQLINGMAPLVGLGGDHAPGVAQAWKDLGKNAVHWDEWKTNPAEAAGKSTFDIASLFVPGGGEAAAASKGARAAVDGAEAAAKTAPKEAAAARALEDVPKSAPHAPEPHAPPHEKPPPPHEDPTPPHDGPTPPHEPPGGRPEPALQPERAEHHGPAESKAPSADRPSAEGEPKSPVEPASPGHGPPPPPPPPPPHPMWQGPPGEGTPPPAMPAEAQPWSGTPSGEGHPPAAEPPQPAATTPSGEGHPPAADAPQPAATTPSGEGHPAAAEEPHPPAAVPSGEDHPLADEVPQPVAAGSNLSHLPLGGEPLSASAAAARAPVSAARSAELASKAADAQPLRAPAPAAPAENWPGAAQPHERPLTHNPEPGGGRPAEPPPPNRPQVGEPGGHPPEPSPHHGPGDGGGGSGHGHGGGGDGAGGGSGHGNGHGGGSDHVKGGPTRSDALGDGTHADHDAPSDHPSSSGLTDEIRDEIRAMEKGTRPDPSEYLSSDFIEHHLDKFHEGAARFMPESNFDKYGIAQRDGTCFVMPKSEADALIDATRGDPRAMERALGLPDGFLDLNDVLRIDIDHPEEYGLRIPSGNEAGANENWIPGGLLPDGASEAVVDGGEIPRSGYSVIEVFK